jgi:dTDP-4-dehydrorhamnose 3,5-epimerase
LSASPQFTFRQSALEDVFIVEKAGYEDLRGSFVKIFQQHVYGDAGIPTDFKECYVSYSSRNVLRGMHFQRAPHGQAKFVSVVEGEVLDVCVGLGTPNPANRGKVLAIVLSRKNGRSLYVPDGYAHGFLVTSESAIVMNLASSVFQPESDAGIRFDSFGFDWPVKDPILSEKDRHHRSLEEVATELAALRGSSA